MKDLQNPVPENTAYLQSSTGLFGEDKCTCEDVLVYGVKPLNSTVTRKFKVDGNFLTHRLMIMAEFKRNVQSATRPTHLDKADVVKAKAARKEKLDKFFAAHQGTVKMSEVYTELGKTLKVEKGIRGKKAPKPITEESVQASAAIMTAEDIEKAIAAFQAELVKKSMK